VKELEYQSPCSVQEAVAALGSGNARILAGGTDLIVQLREGRRAARQVIDVKRIPEMMDVTCEADGSFSIGAAASFSRLAAHRELAEAHPAIVESGRLVGSLQIQNRAGLGGNICNAAPSADAVPAVICLGAVAEIAGPGGRRSQPVEAMFTGPGRTSLAPDEVLVGIRIPPRAQRSAARYLRFTPRREMDIAVAGAASWIRLDDAGRIAEGRIALASVAPTPIRAPNAEARLAGGRPSAALFAEVGRLAAQDASPISDTRGSADYRRELVAVLTRRTLAACVVDLKIKIEDA